MAPLIVVVALPLPLLVIVPELLIAPEAVMAPGVPVEAVAWNVRLPVKLGMAVKVILPPVVLLSIKVRLPLPLIVAAPRVSKPVPL